MDIHQHSGRAAWPSFQMESWPDTQATLHMWTQIVGKLRLALSPPENHFWHSALYVTGRGLTTSPMPFGADALQVDFDFVEHCLRMETSRGGSEVVALAPKTVAGFYQEVIDALRTLGVDVHIWTRPVEVPDPIPFEEDEVHAAYDPVAVEAFWRALIQVDRVFKRFRGTFLGKSSPVHLFWGSFDLAVTRFSGRRAPMWSGASLNVDPHVMHASYSHEVSSAGFWPGDGTAEPLFYSYAVPAPAGFSEARVSPASASYSATMGEFVLPYESVRTSADPDQVLREFLESTYAAAADLGGWDRPLLEEPPACQCDLEGRSHPAL